MINITLLDEIESEIRKESGSIEVFLDSDCRNKDLSTFYDAKFATIEDILDKLKDLTELVEDYNSMEVSDYV